MSWQVPKEHGAWAMLYAPFVLGAAAARRLPWTLLLLLAAATLLFIARESMVLWLRAARQRKDPGPLARQLALQLALGAACGAALVVRERRFELLPLAGFAAFLFAVQFVQLRRREQRSITAEILAILGLTCTAPAAFCVARGGFSGTALWLWLLSALYFASSVFYVKLRVADLQPRRLREQRALRRAAAAYHVAVAAVVLALVRGHVFGALLLLGFAPVLARTAWTLWRPARSVQLRRLGFIEMFYSVLFLLCTAWAVPAPE